MLLCTKLHVYKDQNWNRLSRTSEFRGQDEEVARRNHNLQASAGASGRESKHFNLPSWYTQMGLKMEWINQKKSRCRGTYGFNTV